MKKEQKKRRGRPRLESSWNAETLQDRAEAYFRKCDERVKMVPTKEGFLPVAHPAPYSIEGLCVYLDITRETFSAWRKQSNELGRRAEKIHLKIAANRVEGALDGTQNGSFAQFMLKNNCPENYKEKVEVENTVGETAASIFERALESWQQKLKK